MWGDRLAEVRELAVTPVNWQQSPYVLSDCWSLFSLVQHGRCLIFLPHSAGSYLKLIFTATSVVFVAEL